MDGLKYWRWEMGGWDERQAAAALGVSLKTYRRYEHGGAPPWAVKLLAILAGGALGFIDPAFEGWHIGHGELISPENMAITPGEVRAIPYREALIHTLAREVKEKSTRGAAVPFSPSVKL